MNNPYEAMVNPYPYLQQQQPYYQPIPSYITAGKEYSDGNKFDDMYTLRNYPPPYKLQSITVGQNDKYVVGLGFKYKCGNGEIVETRHNLCNYALSKVYYQITEREFIIADDDYLMEIKGRHGDCLDRIEFLTYLGKNQNFGGKGGEEFCYRFPGNTFSVAKGGFRTQIDQIHFQVSALPDHIYQKLSQKPYTAQVQYPSHYGQNPQSQFPQPQQHITYPISQCLDVPPTIPQQQPSVYNYPAQE